MNKLQFGVGLVVILMGICLIVMSSGCTSATNGAYERHVVVCPNPECPLHDPNAHLSYHRDIDMEYIGMGQRTYLCQVCGEQWTV